jgi:oligopeptide/dipeptide ABC transporter ATP-binding protein
LTRAPRSDEGLPGGARLGDALLEVEGLKTWFTGDSGTVKAVDDVSLRVARGETLALVGESGSGKSVTSLSIMRLVPEPGRHVAGRIRFAGRDLETLGEPALRRIRGREMAMIFQEPMTSLNPVWTIGDQLREAIRLHEPDADARGRALAMLEKVGIADPEARLGDYPHQLSGGMRQRVMIAMALACGPQLLIADEPTTALDVTIQAQILDLMRQLQRSAGGMAMLFITHNLGVVAEIADRVAVMYGGRIVEEGTVDAIFERPRHPYTIGLLGSIPRVDRAAREAGRKRRLPAIPGNVPAPSALPPGCAFAPRCGFAEPACAAAMPELEAVADGHRSRCRRWREIAAGAAKAAPS